MIDPKDFERVGLCRMENGHLTHADGDATMERILEGSLEDALRQQEQRDRRAKSLRQAERY